MVSSCDRAGVLLVSFIQWVLENQTLPKEAGAADLLLLETCDMFKTNVSLYHLYNCNRLTSHLKICPVALLVVFLNVCCGFLQVTVDFLCF